MESTRIKIVVATHKPYQMPKDPIYLPLHVGADLHPEVCTDMQGDNEGNSISKKNAYYCELTGLWWLWKNVRAEYKGLVHYRRYLGSRIRGQRRAKDPFNRIVSGGELATLLERSEIVIAKKGTTILRPSTTIMHTHSILVSLMNAGT